MHRAFSHQCTELSPSVHRAFTLGAQGFFPPVHRAFPTGAQSFYLQYTKLFPTGTQSFYRCTELFPSGAQSFQPPVHRAFSHRCTELSASGAQSFQPPVHRAFSLGTQSFVLAAFATLVCQRNCVFLCKGTKLKIVMPVFWHRNTHVLRKRRVPKLQKAVLFAIVCRFFVAQSFYRYTELFPSGAQSFLPPVHRAFTGTQSFFPRHRAFTLRHTRLITPATSKPPHDTQSFFPPVHRALGAKACHPDRAVGEWRDLVLAFGKARQTLLNSTFCKVVKQKGEGKPTFSTRSFPLSLRPSPLPCGDQGSPPGPPMPCFVAQGFFPRCTELLPVHRAFFLGTQSFYPGKQSPLQCKYKFIYPDFWGREKVFFGHKKNILLGVGK